MADAPTSVQTINRKVLIKMIPRLKLKSCAVALLGSAVLAFGLYNIHSFSGVTEGGVLGLTLLLHHWFDISPSFSGFILNAACYIIGFKVLGKQFIAYSAIAGGGFSIFYAIFEQFEPIWPEIANYPLVAAIVGALFVGVGVGLCVRIGSAPTGDDALAMSASARFKIGIQWVYLTTDFIVLALSATYIPLGRLAYSLLTVVLSGQIIGYIEEFRFGKKDAVQK